MKTNLKRRLLSILLCGIMLAGALSPIYAEEESSASVYTVNTVYDDLIDLPDSDELLEGYLQQQIYDGVSFYGTTAGDRLEGIEKTVYNELKLKLEKVASGEISSTIFNIESDISSLSWTKEQLGVSAIVADGEFTAEALSAVRGKFNGVFDTSKLLNCLLADCPYELYWFDKTKEDAMELSYRISYSSSEISISFLTFSYMVAEAYKGADDYTANISKTSAVKTAVDKAKDIVAEYASKADLEKLHAYRTEICELVSYNHSATGDGVSYGDPWQLIYVFDGDPNTNVVCEGYAKAFQYLCDLSEFTGDVVCNTVTGTMNGGPHMWNVVEYGGKYYLVDITNCDEGSIGADAELFMVGTDLKDGDRTYTFTVGSSQVVYVYDKDQSDLICDGYPVLSESSLSNDETNIYSGTCGDNVKWSLDTDTGVLTISGSGDMFDYYPMGQWASWYSQKELIKSVNIENGITSIGDWAFYGCSNLKSITIPNGTTSIGDSTFYECDNLTFLAIPDSVTSIGNSAFSNCSSLTSITIPESVTMIGNQTFKGCSNLASITIPDGVTSINNGAFSGCSSLTSINIPDSVTSIGEFAFTNCLSLASITIPESVTSIGYEAFSGCSSLTSITIPDSVISICDLTFYWCSSLTSITIPDSVTSIGEYAFSGCSSLTSITIPDSVRSIGVGAFEYCSNLESITIPDSVTSIGDYAFDGCPNLTIFGISGSYAEEYANNNDIPFKSLDSSDKYSGTCGENAKWSLDTDTGVLTISGSGDMDDSNDWSNYAPWYSIKSVNIENGITRIGNCAFEGCSSLTSITIPDSVTSIGSSAFSDCSNLTSITIPESVTSIGYWAFSSCTSLTSITIPESVTSISSGAFSGCSSLTSINIPDSVTSIGSSAFRGCSSLTSITIHDSVTSIGEYAFSDCSNLTSITIPDSVTSIGKYAFDGCSNLTEISVSPQNQYYCSEDGVLFNKDKTTLILCPSRKNGDYIIPDGVASIVNSAFFYCRSLTSITIPDTVSSIGDRAFWGCSSLTSITIPDSVTSIGDNAFYGCYNLTIKCRINSAAYNYAVSNNISCVLIKDYVDTPDAPEVESVTNNTVTLVFATGYEYKMDNGEWQDSNVFSGLNPNKTYTFYQRVKETETTYASESSLGKEVITLKMTSNKPDAPTIETTTYNSVTLTATDGYEYKMDNGEWQDSNVFSGLNPNKTYTFYQRVKETDTAYASESSLGKEVTTKKMSATAPKAPTVASKTTNTVTLKKLSGYEYSKDGKNWQSSNVFKNLKAETEYTFYQRKAETDTSYASDKSVALKVKTMPKESLMNEKGVWYYTVNDKKVNATTLVNYYGTWYYVEKGKVNFNATTLCNYGGTWYYVEKGKVNWKCDTLCYYGGTWYYANNGKVDWKCDTLCYYGGTWYYAKNGKVNWKSDTLCYYGGTWYYAKNGKVDWNCNTLCKYGGTWYYAKNGKVNWKSDTLCYYGGTWYYAKNGKVDWNCNTLCKYGNTWYYVQKGKVNWNAKTLCKYGNTWYYVEKGKLNFNATLRFNYYGKSYNVRNGVVKF